MVAQISPGFGRDKKIDLTLKGSRVKINKLNKLLILQRFRSYLENEIFVPSYLPIIKSNIIRAGYKLEGDYPFINDVVLVFTAGKKAGAEEF